MKNNQQVGQHVYLLPNYAITLQYLELRIKRYFTCVMGKRR